MIEYVAGVIATIVFIVVAYLVFVVIGGVWFVPNTSAVAAIIIALIVMPLVFIA